MLNACAPAMNSRVRVVKTARGEGLFVGWLVLALAGCGGGSSSPGPAPPSPPQPVPSPAPQVTLSSDAVSVTKGTIALLTWAATSATECAAGDGWLGALPISGTEAVGPITAKQTFTVTCTGAGGVASKSVTVDVPDDPLAQLPGAVAMLSAAFVQSGGRPEHEGLIQVRGEPTPTTDPVLSLVELSAHAVSPSFTLIDVNSVPIGSAIPFVANGETEYINTDYLLSFRVPATPFRIRATGTDAVGRQYAVQSSLFQPKGFALRLPSPLVFAVAGTSISVPVRVSSVSGGSYQSAFSVMPVVPLTQTPSSVFSLSPGESKEILLTIDLANVVANTRIVLAGTMSEVTTPSVVNVDSLDIRVF